MDNRFAAWAARARVPLGFAWGAAFLVFSQPTVRLLEVGGGVALAGVLIRAYSAGYLEKGRKLATNHSCKQKYPWDASDDVKSYYGTSRGPTPGYKPHPSEEGKSRQKERDGAKGL